MSIAIVTMGIGDEYRRKTALCRESNRLYAEKHGYTFYDRSEVKKTGLPVSWEKLPILWGISQFDHPYILWIDSDAMIFDHSRKLEDFCNSDYVFSCDSNTHICAGVWLMKNTGNKLRHDLSRWYNTGNRHPRYWEQQAIIENPPPSYECKPELAGIYNKIPVESIITKMMMKHNGDSGDYEKCRAMARLYCFDPDYHFVCHFAGRTVEQRSLEQCISEVYPHIKGMKSCRKR